RRRQGRPQAAAGDRQGAGAQGALSFRGSRLRFPTCLFTPPEGPPMPDRRRSHAAFDRARRLIPGGVNSPARAFGAVGGEPVFIAQGVGPYLYDLDGHRYVDYVGSWGPL